MTYSEPVGRPPKHGPFGEAVWIPDEQRWQLRLNEAGQREVEAFFLKYPDSTALIRHQNPRLAQRAFRTEELLDECRAAIFEAVIKAVIRFTPEYGTQIQTYASDWIVGAVEQVARRYADPESHRAEDNQETLVARPDSSRLEPGDEYAIAKELQHCKANCTTEEWKILKHFFGVDGGIGRSRNGFREAARACGMNDREFEREAEKIVVALKERIDS